ncbi:MAG: proprotein convertase P-domain-containing protein [Planctomycetota bacterium]
MHTLRFGLPSVLAIAVTLTLVNPVVAQSEYLYSFILRDTPYADNPTLDGVFDPNTIFSYHRFTGQATATSTRLADAITQQIPGALVDAFDYGHGAFCLVIPHGDLHFSISRDPITGATGGLAGTELGSEPRADSEADGFHVENVPVPDLDERGTHLKSIEENTHPSTQLRFPYLIEPLLGLHGVTGKPFGAQPNVANVGGFDYYPPKYAEREIYFSIAEPNGPFHPADILRLDDAGNITLFRSYLDLGLTANDNVDALSLDLNHSETVDQHSHGIFSLTRDSESAAAPFSAADLYMVNLEQPGIYWVYRSALSCGLNPGDGDIDSVVSIDPLLGWHDSPNLDGDTITFISRTLLDGRSLVIDGVVDFSASGSVETVAPTIDFLEGDRRTVHIWGQKGDDAGIVGQKSIEVDSAVPPVTDLFGLQNGTEIDWYWTNPGAVDLLVATLDGGGLIPLSPGPISGGSPFLSSVDLGPGVHTLCVQSVVGGVASLPVCATVEIQPGSVRAPDALVSTQLSLRSIAIQYELETDVDLIELYVDGTGVATLTGGTAGSTGSTVIDDLDFGYHLVELRGIAPELTYRSPIDVFLPRPVAGDVLNTGVHPGTVPSGLTQLPSGGLLVTADRLNGLAYRIDPDTLTLVDTIPTPSPGAEIVGVALDPEHPVGEKLIWIVLGIDGVHRLFHSDFDGTNPVLTAPLDPTIGFASVGDLSYDPQTDSFFVADPDAGAYRRISRNGLSVGPLAAMQPITATAIGGGVAVRSDGLVVAPAAVFNPTDASDLAILAPGQTPLATSNVFGVFTGELRGLVAADIGSQGLPSVYAVDETGNLVELVDHEIIAATQDCHQPLFGGLGARFVVATTIEDNSVTELLLDVPFHRYIGDLDVEVHIEHELPSELVLELISPQGTSVVLLSQSLPYATEFNLRFDDLLSDGENDRYGDRGAIDPGGLAAFDGEDIFGTWILRVIDTALEANGTVLGWTLLDCPNPDAPGSFVRGDANDDATINVADGVFILTHLLIGGPEGNCPAALDVNGDGSRDISDVVALFAYSFSGGAPPAEPFPNCGFSPSDVIPCSGYTSCP